MDMKRNSSKFIISTLTVYVQSHLRITLYKKKTHESSGVKSFGNLTKHQTRQFEAARIAKQKKNVKQFSVLILLPFKNGQEYHVFCFGDKIKFMNCNWGVSERGRLAGEYITKASICIKLWSRKQRKSIQLMILFSVLNIN